MIFAAAVLLLIGFACLGVGMRPRLVAPGPHCRRCRFDLIGTDTSREGAACPECGADLRAQGAVTPGLRRRRRRFIAAAGVCLAAAIAVGATGVWASVRGFNWNSVKPTWLLAREARIGEAAAAGAAMLELDNRLGAGKLDQERARFLLTLALAHQADPKATWSVEWGDFLESCRRHEMMSAAECEDYARHAPAVAVDSRPTVMQGTPLAVQVGLTTARGPKNSSLRLIARAIDVKEGDRIVSRGGGGGSLGLGTLGSGSFSSLVEMPREPGLHTLTARWKFSVTPGQDDEHPLAAWEETFPVRVRVLAPSESDVELVEDESLRAGVVAALSVRQCEVYETGSGFDAQGFIYCESPPLPLAFDVYWRSPDTGEEWKLGAVSFANSGIRHGYGYRGGLPRGFGLKTVDVVLKPSERAAAETVGIFKIWKGEVVIKAVPVQLPRESR